MILCTLCDKSYLLKGLALYYSLRNTAGEFTLHWLCLDEDIKQSLDDLHFPGVITYSLADLEATHPELVAAKQNKPSAYGTAYANYCWTLTPWFTNYILCSKVPDRKLLLYVDADLFFYYSPQLIIDAIGTKSVGIHTHRFGGEYNEDQITGWYNVGLVAFRNDEAGNCTSEFWMGLLLDQSNKYFEKYGTCGDQKYLELFIPFAGRENVCVFDDDADIGHLAPWNCSNTCILTGPRINHKHKIQPVVFFHFSHFTYDEKTGGWADSINGEWHPAIGDILPFYQNYASAITYHHTDPYIRTRLAMRQPKKNISIAIIGVIKVDETKPDRLAFLLACIRSYAFLKEAGIYLMLESPSPLLINAVREQIIDIGFADWYIGGTHRVPSLTYGDEYTMLLAMTQADFVINFMEDQFMLIDDRDWFFEMLQYCYRRKVDVIKSSFLQVEKFSVANCAVAETSEYGQLFFNDQANHLAWQKHYGRRFYIGVNFITSLEFAKKFWGRDIASKRPHEYEIEQYDPAFQHLALVPARELQCAIDDDHGAPDSALMYRAEPKFSHAMIQVTRLLADNAMQK